LHLSPSESSLSAATSCSNTFQTPESYLYRFSLRSRLAGIQCCIKHVCLYDVQFGLVANLFAFLYIIEPCHNAISVPFAFAILLFNSFVQPLSHGNRLPRQTNSFTFSTFWSPTFISFAISSLPNTKHHCFCLSYGNFESCHTCISSIIQQSYTVL